MRVEMRNWECLHVYLDCIPAAEIAAEPSIGICHESVAGIIGTGVTAYLPVRPEGNT